MRESVPGAGSDDCQNYDEDGQARRSHV
jgi:hypothetical protein